MHTPKPRKKTVSKPKKGLVVPATFTRKTGINKNAKPPKATNPIKPWETLPYLNFFERAKRIDFIRDKILVNQTKQDIREQFCEEFQVKSSTYDEWYDQTRDLMQSEIALARENSLWFYLRNTQESILECRRLHDNKSIAPLLKDFGEKIAWLKWELPDVKLTFNLADLHKANAKEDQQGDLQWGLPVK